MARKLVVDFFAGGGGASHGLSQALGRCPDIAINHDPEALKMHAANHPKTLHVLEDIFKADLRKLVRGRKVGLAWFSPDCRHFSRAKGGKPVSKGVRSLAWIVIKAASQISPDVIILENVREFAEWGPLTPRWLCRACGWKGTEGQVVHRRDRHLCPTCDSRKTSPTEDMVPDPTRKGLTFKRWLGRLRNLGYQVQFKTLDAADYGAPTHRKRLFLIARRDGKPVVWPEPTHADKKKLDQYPLFGRPSPYRTAAECIDWEIPCRSIFEREKPLADRTMRRIAYGMKRYVLENPRPFIVPVTHAGERREHPVDEPLPTITSAHRGEFALVAPVIAQLAHGEGKDGRWGRGSNSATDPLGTIHSGGNNHAIAAATLIQTGYGERTGQRPRALDIEGPLGTVVGGGQKHAAVAAMLTKFRGDSIGQSIEEPMPTITSGAGAARPAGAAHALGASVAYLARFNHGDKQWSAVDEPLGTVTSQGNKFGIVYAFLMKYFGSGGQWQMADVPLHTATVKARFGLVTVEVQPGRHEPAVAIDVDGLGPCVIADIGLRMLTPRELARAQGFPDSYVLIGTKSQQVAKVGNSVPPVMAKAIASANYKGSRHATQSKMRRSTTGLHVL